MKRQNLPDGKRLFRLIAATIAGTVALSFVAMNLYFFREARIAYENDIRQIRHDFIRRKMEENRKQIDYVNWMLAHRVDDIRKSTERSLVQRVEHARKLLEEEMAGLDPVLQKEEIVRRFRERIHSLPFFSKGDVSHYLTGYDGISLMESHLSHFEGTDISGFTDAQGHQVVKGLVRLAQNGGGVTSYYFLEGEGEQERLVKMIAYVVPVPELSAYLGAERVLDEVYEEARAEMLSELKEVYLRRDPNFFIIDTRTGRAILNSVSQVVGQRMDRSELPGVREIYRQILAATGPDGNGTARYRWSLTPERGNLSEKVSFVKKVKDLGWIVGTGFFPKEAEALVARKVAQADEEWRRHVWIMVFSVLGLGVVLSLVTFFLGRMLKGAFADYMERIRDYVETEQYLRKILTTVAEINQYLLAAEDENQLLELSCRRLAAEKEYPYVWIGREGEGGRLIVGEIEGDTFGLPEKGSVVPEKDACPAALAFRENRIVSMRLDEPTAASGEEAWWVKEARKAMVVETLGFPLTGQAGERPWGALCVTTSNPDGFQQEEEKMLEELAGDIGFGVDALRRRKALARLNAELEKRVEEEVARRRTGEQLLIQQSRLAAMGDLLSQVAHYWRQPLNALALHIQDLPDAYDHNELDKQYLEKLVGVSMGLIQGMSGTINDFRNFFVASEEKSRFDAAVAVAEAIHLLEEPYGEEKIRLAVENFLSGPMTVEGYPGEFRQSLLHLIANGRDAVLCRRKHEGDDREGRILLRLAEEGDAYRIDVEDDGEGIDDAVIGKIFDPYFTTKTLGEGTGISLFMARTVIEEHMGGALEGKNREGEKGARFTIRFKK